MRELNYVLERLALFNNDLFMREGIFHFLFVILYFTFYMGDFTHSKGALILDHYLIDFADLDLDLSPLYC
jgi:hypothetical protein